MRPKAKYALGRFVALMMFCVLSLNVSAQAAMGILYVQGNYATPQTPQTMVNVKFNAGQIAGDLNIIVVGWNDSTATVGAGRYSYRVRATDTGGNLSPYSSVAGGVIPDTQAPTAPSGLTATVSGNQINLRWTASTDNVGVTGYRVERCQGAGCTTFAQIAALTTTTYSNTGLGAGGYSYRVRATDAAGNLSVYSNVATANVQAKGWLLITPSSTNFGNVALGSYSTKSVVLSNTSTTSVTISQANVAGREFSITGLSLPLTLAAGQNSTFSVVFDPGSAGAVTGSVSLVSTATNSPTAETLSGTAIHVVDLSWLASTSTVAGYNVYRGTVSGGPLTKLNSSLIIGTTYVDLTVQVGQTYYYYATAVDSNNNESKYSNEASAFVLPP